MKSSPIVSTAQKAKSQIQLERAWWASETMQTPAISANEAATISAPVAILVTDAGSRCFSPARVHQATSGGVPMKMISGFSAWNQVSGICQPPATCRSTPASVHSAMVLPFCS